MRALSAICSLAAVAALGALLHTLSGPRATLLAMSMAAFSGTQIVFAQEARPYAMALLWLVLAAVALVAIERRGFTWTRAGKTISATGGSGTVVVTIQKASKPGVKLLAIEPDGQGHIGM